MTARPDQSVPLLIEPQFLSHDDCARIRRAMDHGVGDPAEIVSAEIVARERIRRTTSVEIESALRGWFERRLDDIRPVIEQTLNRPLGDREGTGFLRYAPGGFYLTHRDRGEVAGWPAAARRAASIVVFLNGSAGSLSDGFEGGLLCLYGTDRPVEIIPRAGLLVAFPADILHEVLPVRRGVRDAAVDWFYDP